ncbi:hypothetical protein NKDENANG_03073 [Candidatus Entotheonellaceae bacterium PAL068K]
MSTRTPSVVCQRKAQWPSYVNMAAGYATCGMPLPSRWYDIHGTMQKRLYGEDHPLVYNSGGKPSAIRSMTAEALWAFHGQLYHLRNMGRIAAVPYTIEVDNCLQELARIIARRHDDEKTPDDHTGIRAYDLLEPRPSSRSDRSKA